MAADRGADQDIGKRHGEFQRQLRLALEAPEAPPGSSLDVAFLTRYFALAGLPVKRPRDETSFVRNTDEFSLSINAPTLGIVGGKRDEKHNIGVPWGPKARLLTVWLSTAAQDPARGADDRWVDIGPIKGWLASIGVNVHGDAPSRAKEQLLKLTFASFNMQVRRAGLTLFSNETLIEKGVFGERDLAHYAAGNLKDVRWPVGLQLSRNAFDRFRENGIAIPTQRLTRVSHSAMAIDTLVFLCYRLPLIERGEEDLVTWRQLALQFGSREPPSKFRESFDSTIRQALDAYPEAQVQVTDEGLRLRHSDPAVLSRAFVALPPRDPPRARAKAARTGDDRRHRLRHRSEDPRDPMDGKEGAMPGT